MTPFIIRFMSIQNEHCRMLSLAFEGKKIFVLSILSLLFLGVFQPLNAQRLRDYLGDETVLYAETKQVNQFFRRFNCEESPKGIRYYKGDPNFRNPQKRSTYLPILFDLRSPYIAESVKNKFIKDINNPRQGKFLDFYSDGWFAEVKATFSFYGKEENATLFLKLQKEPVGFKWVFTQVFFSPFKNMFVHSDSLDGTPPFIHPLSHELDFMELRKVFRDDQAVELYASREYTPDHLTLFLYEIKRGNIKFVRVNKTKFHFLQVDNWYFELSEFNRSGNNRGWLISQLINIPDEQKRILLKYIYHE